MNISLLEIEVDLRMHTFRLDLLNIATPYSVRSLLSVGWWYGVFELDFLFKGGWIE